MTIAQVFGGRVTSTPAGIDCQSDPPNSSRTKGVCAAAFDEGATVTLAWTWTMAAGPAQFHVTGPGGATDECAGTSDHCTLRLVGGDYAVSVDAVTIPPFPAQ